MKKTVLIINPVAGRGKARRLENEIVRRLKINFPKLEIYRSQYTGHAREIAGRVKNDAGLIIAAGGDGTVHEVVNGMMGGASALAVIPIGSGNDFTKMLNLPREPAEAVEVICRNQRTKVDIGKAGDHYFPNGLGMGFDAWVVRESRRIKRLRGFSIYLYAVLKTVFLYNNHQVKLYINGHVEETEIYMIAVGNGRAMGGGFYLTPQASITDGKLDVCIIHGLKKREVFQNLVKAIKGNHTQMRQVSMERTDRLKMQCQQGIAVHADGELLGMDIHEMEITVLPAALEVIHQPS
ncbi:MAG: diacylglycerol kinase family protein [Calditrichia bacterium]